MSLVLPDGARVAVWVVINVEVFGPPGRPTGPSLQPHLASNPEIANWGWRDYGNRVGLARLAQLFDDLQIPVTAAVNAFACYDVPGLIELIKTRRWCVVAHGTRNDVRHDLLSEAEERAEIAETTEVLRTAFGVRPRGWLTPGFAVSSHTHELLAEAGYEYVLDWTNDDIPYWIGAGSRELFALPYSLESNDISLCIASGLAPPAFASAIEDHVLELWKEGAVVPKTTAVGLHTFVAGQPARLRHLRAALAALRDREGIWWSTADELADATRDQCR